MKIMQLTLLLSVAACEVAPVQHPASPSPEAPLTETPTEITPTSEVIDLLSGETRIEPAETPEGADLLVLARIGTGEGNYVEFFAAENDEEDVGIGIMAPFPHKPLLAEDFLRGRSAVDVFLALPLDRGAGLLSKRHRGRCLCRVVWSQGPLTAEDLEDIEAHACSQLQQRQARMRNWYRDGTATLQQERHLGDYDRSACGDSSAPTCSLPGDRLPYGDGYRLAKHVSKDARPRSRTLDRMSNVD